MGLRFFVIPSKADSRLSGVGNPTLLMCSVGTLPEHSLLPPGLAGDGETEAREVEPSHWTSSQAGTLVYPPWRLRSTALARGPFLVRTAGAGQFAGTADWPLEVPRASPSCRQGAEQDETPSPGPAASECRTGLCVQAGRPRGHAL